MVDKLLLSRSGNYSMRVQVPLPLYSLNFNIFGLNLSEFYVYALRPRLGCAVRRYNINYILNGKLSVGLVKLLCFRMTYFY
jgi:hypothetical protein